MESVYVEPPSFRPYVISHLVDPESRMRAVFEYLLRCMMTDGVVEPSFSSHVSRDSEYRKIMLGMLAAELRTSFSYVRSRFFDYMTSCGLDRYVPSALAGDISPVAWHVNRVGYQGNSLVMSDGMCYLTFIEPEHRTVARDFVGVYPTLLSLLSLPSYFFKDFDEVEQMVMYTDDFSVPVPGLKAAHVLTCMMKVARSLKDAIFPPGSVYHVLKTMPLDLQPDVNWYDMVGGVDGKWHVFFHYDEPRKSFFGKCYLHCCKYRIHDQAVSILGTNPSVYQLLMAPKGLFRHPMKLAKVWMVRSGVAEPRAVSALYAFAHAVRELDCIPEGSFAEKCTKSPFYHIDDVETPSLRAKLGAGDVIDESKVAVTKVKKEALVPTMSEGVSNGAFECLKRTWGVRTGDAEEELLTSVSEVFAISTNNVFVANSSFTLNGVTESLSVLTSYLCRHTDASNSVRNWVRSFRDGEIISRISGLLDDVSNVALRQRALTKYSAPDRFAYLCFDTARWYLRRESAPRYVERVCVRMLRDVNFSSRPLTHREMCWLDP